MNRICWRWADILSRMLERNEREAVRGDLAESGETGFRTLLGVLGLVARRQAALWTHWRPWLALVGLIVPLGMLLSVASRRIADSSAIYIWLYANNWDWAFVRNPGFRHDLVHYVSLILLDYLTLVCWSWTGGFVLGAASRGMIQINGVLFCVMLSFGALLGAPLYFAYYLQYLHRALGLRSFPDPNAAVFALTFYRVMLPLIVQAVLVVVPSLWGMRHGAGVARLRPLLRTTLWAAAIATLAAIVIQNPNLWLFVRPRPVMWQGWLRLLLQVVAYWPVAYLAESAVRRRWHDRIAFS
ncbi:MAG TPA: hypothetical protein VI455_03535 [Terriglobia bacterium]